MDRLRLRGPLGWKFQPFPGIWPEVRPDIDGEGEADRGGKAGLRIWSTPCGDKGESRTYKSQGGVDIPIVLLLVLSIVLHRPPFTHSGNRDERGSRSVGDKCIR